MTNKIAFPQLREQAVALRRAGKSRDQIKDILGVRNNESLSDLLRGVPPPAWTRRPRAKDAEHAKACELRAQGRTCHEIASELGVSTSSVSRWVRDMPRLGRLSYEECRKRNADGVARYWEAVGTIREARRHAICESAVAQIGTMNDREVLIAGAVAYWCEGTKSKVYAPRDRVTFINSDPHLITFFLRFLAVAGVTADRLICRVHIHESADVPAAQAFWQMVTGLPADQFRRPTLKRHNPRTVRKNTGDEYHGCLIIGVRRSTELYRQIQGWAAAAMAARGADQMGH
jgi:Homeodomain-like domain